MDESTLPAQRLRLNGVRTWKALCSQLSVLRKLFYLMAQSNHVALFTFAKPALGLLE
jgi:hypothetical protein